MKQFRYKDVTSYALMLMLVAWAFYLLDSVHSRWVEGHERTDASEQLVQRSVAIGNALNGKLSTLYGLRSFVESNIETGLVDREFDNIAATLRGNSAAIRAVQLVHDGVITHMFPLEGNESAFGHNLLDDPRPAVAVGVRRAYGSDFITIEGPLELKQGGMAVIARLPVRDKRGIWGLAAIVVDLPELFIEAGLTEEDSGLRFSARDEHHGVFFGDEQVFASTPELQRIPLLDGYWDLAVAPVEGWLAGAEEQILGFRISGAVILLLLFTLFVISTRSRRLLRRLVERRTQELEALNTELRHEVEARRRTESELIAARDKAEHSDRLKDAFIATMSHEIRTPLHVILGYVDLISDPGAASSEDRSLFTSSMKSAGRRLMRSVEELLHISSLKAGTFSVTPEDFDIVSSVRDLCAQYRPMAKERGLSLVFKSTLASAAIYADRYSLEQAMMNLVDNAIKYTEKGEVEVFVRGEGNDCTLCVRDTGIGIAEEYVRHVFDVFSQEKTGYNRPYDGLGLGLSLTRQFVELNNGRIDVRSEKGRGSEFTISLPTITPVEHGIAEEVRLDAPVSAAGPTLTLIQSMAHVA